MGTFSKGKGKRDDELKSENLPHIFPLSPKSNMSENDMTGLRVYERYLLKAFSEPCIRNILICGEFGIGKSSVIRSFEKEFQSKNKKNFKWLRSKEKVLNHKPCGFLYVSLGDYAVGRDVLTGKKLSGAENREQGGESPCANNQVKTDDKHDAVLERRLLLQIYSRFHKADLPASCFKLIQEHNILSRYVIPAVCAIMTAVLLLLGYHEPIGGLLSRSFPFLDPWKPWIHLALYAVAIAIASIGVYFVVKNQLPKFTAKSLKIKADTLEAQYESNACESYLDQHAMELVYCLEQIAKKIDYTVVFEDLDWFNVQTCLAIFTRLREINYLVNLRLTQKKRKSLRFIYVANNGLLSSLKHSKFFDYILPIYPRLNQKTADKIFVENIGKVNEDFNKENNSNITVNVDNKLFYVIAPYLKDYREQYAILNEYGILLRVYRDSNRGVTDLQHIAVNILALSVYKNLFPADYAAIWDGESKVLPQYVPDAFNEKQKKLLDILQPYLPVSILYYVGFSKEKIVELREEQLEKDLRGTLQDAVNIEDEELVIAVQRYCEKRIKVLSEKKDNARRIKGQLESDFAVAIKYLVFRKYENWTWVFNQSVSALLAIEVLSCIKGDGETIVDETVLGELFCLINFDINGEESVFQKCKEFDALSWSRNLEAGELKTLILGTGRGYNGYVDVNGKRLSARIREYYTEE